MIWRRNATLIVMFVVLGVAPVLAQNQFVEYSAKFLCGTPSPDTPPGAGPVSQGVYNTSINIHNPQLPINPPPSVTFVKKAVVSLPEGPDKLPPSQFRVDRLTADFAEEVDCGIIRSLLGNAGTASFIEGFVVLIAVPQAGTPPPLHELDVVGVYTVTTPQGQSISLEVTPVAPRFITLPAPTAARMRRQLLEQAKKQ